MDWVYSIESVRCMIYLMLKGRSLPLYVFVEIDSFNKIIFVVTQFVPVTWFEDL